MREKIGAVICFLIVMAMLPVLVVNCENKYNAASFEKSTSDSAAVIENKSVDEKGVINAAAGLCKQSYCDETLKAILILTNTNCGFFPDSIDSNNDNSDLELYSKIERIYNSNKELYLFYNGEKKYIPYSPSSNGVTIKSDEYDYLNSVASPWDCFSDGYSEENQCLGVSLDGVNYLCENGFTAEEALMWYLPNFKIKNI